MKRSLFVTIFIFLALGHVFAADFVSDGDTYFYLENFSPTSGWGAAMWIDEDCPYAWLHVWNDSESKNTEAFEQISGNHYRVKVPTGTWKHFQLRRGASLHTTSNETGNIDFSSGKNWLLTYGTASGWTDATWALNKEYDGTEKIFIQNIVPGDWSDCWSKDANFRLFVYLSEGTSDAVWCDAVVESSADYASSTVYSITPPAGCYRYIKLARNNKKSFDGDTEGRGYTGNIDLDPSKNYISGGYSQNGTGGTWGNFELSPIVSDGTKKLYFDIEPAAYAYTWTANPGGTAGDGNYAFFFGTGDAEAWSAHAVQVTGDYYYVLVPEGTWNGWILTRNSVTSNPAWTNMYDYGQNTANQTSDIFFTKNKNYLSNFNRGSSTVTWGQYAPTPSIILNQGAPDAYPMGLKESTIYTKDMSFTEHSTYEIQILDGETVFGLDNNVWTGPVSDYALVSAQYQVRIATAGTGTYKFTYDQSDNTLSAEYPSASHPSMDYCYLFDHTWSQVYVYLSSSTSGIAGTNGWGTQTTNKVQIGSDYYYYFATGDYTDLMVSDETDNNKATGLTPTRGKYQKNISSSWGWRTFSGFTITLNNNDATTYPDNPTVEFNGAALTSITAPTKTGYTFGGYWSNSACNRLMLIDSNGAWQASKNGYTDASKVWIHDGGTATLYAKWTPKTTTITFDKNSGTGGSDGVTGTYDAAMPSITPPTRSGFAFGGYWDSETDDNGSGTQYYNADGSSANSWDKEDASKTLYARWYTDLKVWCEPDVTITGDIHLTSYKDLFVQSSSTAGNALNVTSTDWGSATEMEIAYLGAGDTEVAKGDSHFRLYGDNTNTAVDASSSSVDISASRTFNTDYSIRYTPSAYNTTNTYKLQLTFKKGEYTLKTVTHNLYGRSLPEEFVIALKDGDYWYALPNNIVGNNKNITPIKITVDNTTTPTQAVYAASNTAYKMADRYTAANRYALRFKDLDTETNHWLQVSKTESTNYVWLSTTGSTDCQDWKLTSSDFNSYTITLPTASATKQLGINDGKIGYFNSPSSGNIYFLPITTKYTPREASVYEWGEHGVIVEADMTDVASAAMHIDGASPSAATVTGVNGSLGSTKYAKVDGGALTVGAVANDGKLLYIHWKNSGGTEIAASQITIPCVIAADASMSDLSTDKASWAKKEVHILPGKTLTADGASFDEGNVTVPTMYVYPGATLDITTGKLTASTLRLRSGWTRAGTKKYDVARVHIASGKALSKSTFTLDYDIYDTGEGMHYYPIAVPFHTAVKDIDYLDETLKEASVYGTHYVIKRYDGASRAANGAIDDNWVVVPLKDAVDADVSLQPSEGYIMTGVGIPAYGGCIIRFPLDANDNWTNDGEKASYSGTTKNVIAVTHHTGAATAGGGANVRHEGWNMLANPYMACFATNGNTTHSEDDGFIKGHFTITGDPADPYGWTEDDDNIYVSVPTHDFSEYIQKEITEAELLPGWSFFIQAAETGNVTFAVDGQATSDLPIYAPKRKEAENMPTVKTGIVLSSETASDKTTFLISDKYSDEYEIGADLEKMFGNGYTLATYSLNNDTRLAFNAMSTNDAKSVIPVGIRIPADGSYTFSLNERYADADIERIDLIDYETNTVTNLTAEDYTFNATRSQNDERFAINITPRAQTPTDIGDTGIDDTNGVRKILLNETIYIIRDGRVYDATGKRVTTINK